ncbi:phospholipid-translocating P-type ATPase (flippase) [Trypanosoma theileri]|uniref:Phospholipid-transporting ATPase n=1 Tax=Trypanosoma theileri TaxID=67003 RepID=A0A1X0P1Z0_9TRYP|nr:phospholipid-translocating P-type ATPase (flippase) [Trypanosoma theileri]ORC90848.1 phospholipid-translocating P-type ATPase (flippase) [Trypanosoma theileri]
MRTITPLDPTVAAAHPDNTVKNSRYTLYNFVFLNLYEQFRRPLNFYFLLVACLQFISVIAPVSPLSTILPLAFAFSLTALKEGYDDIKRHRQDALYNNKKRHVLNPHTMSWQLRRNYTIRVGDVILLEENEELPCDVVVVAASSQTVYIRTDNLDGELDLKPKEIVFPHIRTPEEERDPEVAAEAVNRDPHIIHLDDSCEVLMEKLSRLKLICPPPSAMIESFDARAEFHYTTESERNEHPSQISLTHHHLLPQSCRLKNTKSIICVAVYTGDETKCGMNKRPAPVKWAKIDQDVSKYAIFVFCCQILNAFAFGITGYLLNRDVENHYWYLQVPRNEASVPFIIYPLRFFLLTTVMIPVSFKFVVDMSKYYMAMTVEWDETMKHRGPESEGCRVKNSGILEDLGQIDYVLSDKTGTMTQNVMELLYVSVGDERFSLHQNKVEGEENNSTTMVKIPTDERVLHFGRILSLCNSVEVSKSNNPLQDVPSNSIQYQAASPDEEALCRGASHLHVKLIHRDVHEYVLNVNGVEEKWIHHYTFPFSSELKTMGVIVEEKSTGIIYYFVKGADDRILEMRTKPSSSPLGMGSRTRRMSWQDTLNSHLETYAMQGLRTLVVAEKKIEKEELQSFLSQVKAAELTLHGRREKLQELRSKMETGVQITGITAIEDKLQDSVKETVQDFLQAGIKVWMLTGDKVQTAEQIALSCGLYNPSNRVLRIVSGGKNKNNNDNDENAWEKHMMELSLPPGSGIRREEVSDGRPFSPADVMDSEVTCDVDSLSSIDCTGSKSRPERSGYNTLTSPRERNTPTVLVVEGGTVLERILNTPSLAERFTILSDACVSVICARVTPSQKAAVTQFVRSKGFMTLAVGDGGNDVAMLQEAHVGVGIVGKEGKQAARAADFSITRFSDLRALLFVHGQLAYTRTAYVIKYSFYKSMLISFIQLAFNVVGTYVSGGTFWNSFSLTLWNGAYTLPQTLFFCLDRIAPRTVLERHPFLYKMTRHATDMNIVEFFIIYICRGIVQSVVTLWLVLSIFGSSFAFADSGISASKDVTFSVAYSALILSQMITLILESHSITFLNAIWIFGMPPVYAGITALYSHLSRGQYYGVWGKTMNIISLLTAFGIAAVLVLPVFGLMVIRRIWIPDPRDALRTSEIWNRMRRVPHYGFGSCLSRLNRWLLCVPEEPSYYMSNTQPTRGVNELC